MKTKRFFLYIILASALSFTTKPALSQVEQLQNICSLYFSPEYISDGQEYFASLKPDQKVEFRTTFYGENTYRIVACTNLKKGDLVFTVFDTEKNQLFTNASYNYSQYWDFKFSSTITCIIQVDVKNIKFSPGFVMLLVGYKP